MRSRKVDATAGFSRHNRKALYAQIDDILFSIQFLKQSLSILEVVDANLIDKDQKRRRNEKTGKKEYSSGKKRRHESGSGSLLTHETAAQDVEDGRDHIPAAKVDISEEDQEQKGPKEEKKLLLDEEIILEEEEEETDVRKGYRFRNTRKHTRHIDSSDSDNSKDPNYVPNNA